MPTQTFKKTNLMRQVEMRFPGKSIEQIVVDAINRCGSAEAAAEELGVSGVTLRKVWMPTMGIRVRSEAVIAAEVA